MRHRNDTFLWVVLRNSTNQKQQANQDNLSVSLGFALRVRQLTFLARPSALLNHPGVEILSRDRGGGYGEAAAQ